jgi:hypothetical protein
LSLPDSDLDQSDLVAMNLMVAREIPSLSSLDIPRYCGIVDQWTRQFASVLPEMEAAFHRTPAKWKNDLRFFRVGMLAGFLGHEIGIRYLEDQKHAQAAHYLNPADLFLNGLIDTRQGACASMPTLHVAIARRLGWPVSLASVKSHFISRYDDGEVYHNIEATNTHPGGFVSNPDEVYIQRFDLPPKAISSGSDLRRLSTREMLGVFVAFRARHFLDSGEMDRADRDYALARALIPTHRRTYIAAMAPFLNRGSRLFELGELGHPNSLPIVGPANPAGQGFGSSAAPSSTYVISLPAGQTMPKGPAPFSSTTIAKEQL